MKDSTVKENKMTPWEKECRRYYKVRKLVIIAAIILTIAGGVVLWKYSSPFWAIILIAFTIWSILWYEKGATNNCVDEYEYAYPKDGFRYMLISWAVFIALTIGAYYLCKAKIPCLI